MKSVFETADIIALVMERLLEKYPIAALTLSHVSPYAFRWLVKQQWGVKFTLLVCMREYRLCKVYRKWIDLKYSGTPLCRPLYDYELAWIIDRVPDPTLSNGIRQPLKLKVKRHHAAREKWKICRLCGVLLRSRYTLSTHVAFCAYRVYDVALRRCVECLLGIRHRSWWRPIHHALGWPKHRKCSCFTGAVALAQGRDGVMCLCRKK